MMMCQILYLVLGGACATCGDLRASVTGATLQLTALANRSSTLLHSRSIKTHTHTQDVYKGEHD